MLRKILAAYLTLSLRSGFYLTPDLADFPITYMPLLCLESLLSPTQAGCRGDEVGFESPFQSKSPFLRGVQAKNKFTVRWVMIRPI